MGYLLDTLIVETEISFPLQQHLWLWKRFHFLSFGFSVTIMILFDTVTSEQLHFWHLGF